jgi:hypothetical protein
LNAQPAITVAFAPIKNKFAGSLTRRTVDRFGPWALTACFAFERVKPAATSRWHHQQRQRRQ